MSYSPHTWVNNETITYQKLNNIEEGVQESISAVQGMVGLMVAPVEFNIYSHILGFVGYFKQQNSKWCLASEPTDVFWYSNNIASVWSVVPPQGSGIKVFWAIYAPDLNSVDLVDFSGEIESTPITVYSSDGVNAYNGYELTGTCFVKAIAT